MSEWVTECELIRFHSTFLFFFFFRYALGNYILFDVHQTEVCQAHGYGVIELTI